MWRGLCPPSPLTTMAVYMYDTYTYVFVYAYTYMFIYECVYIHTYIHTDMHVYIHRYKHTYMQIYLQINKQTPYIQLNMQTYNHEHICGDMKRVGGDGRGWVVE